MVIRNSQQLSFEENNNFKSFFGLYTVQQHNGQRLRRNTLMLHIFLLLPLSFLFDFKLSNETCMLIVLVLVHIFTNLLCTSHFCFSAHVSRLYIILVRFFSRHFICKRFTFLLYKTLCGLHVHCIIFILDLRTSKYLTFEIF